jgi:membrane protease YdiL (CAAX protease family)
LLLFVAGGFLGFLLAFGVAALFGHSAFAPSTRQALARYFSGVVESPLFLVSMIWLTTVCTALFVLAAARTSPLGTRERLGLRRGRVTAGDLPAIVAANFGAIGCGLTLMYALQRAGVPGLRSSESGRMFGSLAAAAPVLKLASVVGACLLAPLQEELLFRGFLQRGLLRSWRPAVAIAVTAGLFALVHGEPVKWTALIFSSLWLGYLAWRADSIFPSVVCHAGANGLFSVIALLFIKADAGSASKWTDVRAVQHIPLVLVLVTTLLSLALLGQGIALVERRARLASRERCG